VQCGRILIQRSAGDAFGLVLLIKIAHNGIGHGARADTGLGEDPGRRTPHRPLHTVASATARTHHRLPGRVETVTDEAGQVTTMGFDANDRVKTVTDVRGAVTWYSRHTCVFRS
jgi:YD repeat-containing protein